MSCKKIIFVISFLAISGFLFNLNTPAAKAMTTAEIQALIQQLSQQIAQLQKQLTEMESAPAVWCHDFNTNLRYADKGTEVEALQTVLTKEGFDVSGDHSGSFEDYTASAVVGFQEKYKKEILSPLGLLHGTGFVGKGTRAELNMLYGCGAVTSTPTQTPVQTPTPTTPTTQIPVIPKTTIESNIQVTSPVGLERWVIGNTYEIKWKSYGVSKVDIVLVGADEKRSLASGLLTSEGEGKFSWKVEGVNPGQSWRIQIWSTEKPTVYAESPLLFKIVAAPTTTSSIIVISPNGGENWTLKKYNTMKFSVISSTGGLIKADVKLINKDTNNEYEMGNFYLYPPETLVSFYFSFSQNIPPGNHYVLNVSSLDFGIVGDESDNYFSVSETVSCKQETTGVTCGGLFYEDYCEKSADGMIYAAKRKCSYSMGSDCSSLVATADRTLCSSGGCDKGICTGTLKEGEKPLTITSPNGGENLVIGNTYTIRWANPGSIRNLTVDLYKYGTRFTGLGGMGGSANYPAPTSSLWFTVSTANLVPGLGFKIRVWSSDDPTIYDESDNYFSIIAVIPSPATCDDLKSNSGTNYFFDLCKKGGCDGICFNKYYATYQGCGKSFEYDYCTVYNANADKNILCDTGLVYTCADSDNWKEYYKQGTVTDSGKTYTDYCVDSSILKEYFCFASDSYPTGTVNEENYTCSNGCENGVCKTIEKPRISVVTPNGGDSWTIGNTHSVQLSCSAGVNKPINIFLKDNRTESLPKTLFTGVTCNVGETSIYNWIVSSDVNPGENAFKIRIETTDSLLIDESDNYFSIVSAPTIPSITVILPNGGESWTFGNTYGITWKSSGVKTASVYLWFSDGTTCKLADVPAENGKYSVQFAENQLCTTQNISIKITTGRYRIKIYTENEKVDDSSDNYFSIVSATPISTTPIITVTYPNGGEIWTKDMTYTVKWSVNGLFSQGSKRVILEKSGVSVLQYSGNAENADLFNLTLTSADIVPDKDYKIKVEFADTNNTVIASDTSDNYFEIVSGGAGLKNIENQLASISAAISQLIESIKELMGR